MNASRNRPKAKAKATTPTAPAGPPTVTDKSRQLQVKETPDKTRDQLLTDIVSQGMASNASTAMRFVTVDFGDLSLTDMVASLREQGEAVNRGEFAALERMLHAQGVALNAIFAEMARRAAANMGEHLGATETYLRLALKAQSQCRSTFEALAELKNPRPVAFVKQANFAQGNQQVNNCAGQVGPIRAGAHAGKPPQSKLLEASDVGRLDTGTQSTAGGANSHMAPVGEVNGAAH